jgi:hypothetical protein
VNLINSTTAYNTVISDIGLKGMKHVGMVTKCICTWIIFVHNIILSHLLCYGYDTLFLTLREEHGVKYFTEKIAEENIWTKGGGSTRR